MDRWTLSVRQFRLIAALTAGGLCLLVVAGGIVRLTGSGLGCDDWPNCNAQSFVDVSSGHTAIEPGLGTFDLTDSSTNDKNHSVVVGLRFGFGG